MIKNIALLALIFSLTSCGVIKGSKNWFVDKFIKSTEESYVDDNPTEESIEEKIESLTGLEVDLSPASPEKK